MKENHSLRKGWLRLVSLALCFVMLLTLLPATALAAEPIDGIRIFLTLPQAGSNNMQMPDVYTPEDDHYDILEMGWCDKNGEYITHEFTFEARETYYLRLTVDAENGYFFRQGSDGTKATAFGGEIEEYSITNISDGTSVADIVISFRVVQSMLYFSVWMSDDEQHARVGGRYKADIVSSDGSPVNGSGEVEEYFRNYYIPNGSTVTLTAYPEEGYRFEGWYQANIDKSSENDPNYFPERYISNVNPYTFVNQPIPGDDPNQAICAVFKKRPEREADQIQIWATDGGKVAAKYTVSGANPYDIPDKDGTDFMYKGEIVVFYSGDEVTAIAQADEGYVFRGWYHVNIEWGPGEGEKYEGSVISTSPSITYKPGFTVLPGDTEALRYVCAVFDRIADRGPVEEFVTRLYRNLLGREPEADGLAAWTDALLERRSTGAKVVYKFVYSDEFQSNPLGHTDFVKAMYLTILGREPDDDGLKAWVNVLKNGCTRKKVLAGFLNSAEMKALCESIGIEPGSYYSDDIVDQNSKVTFFVTRMYHQCLSREADYDGLAAWVSALLEGRADGMKIANGFFFSPEMEAKNLSNTVFVTQAYITLMDRGPDRDGLKAWTDALDNGASREKIIKGFVGSDEFGKLCED